MTGQNVNISLDTLLHLLAITAWVLLIIYVLSVFFSTLHRRGIRYAVLALFSFRVLLPVLLAVGISLLSAALVFVYPQQAAVVVSIVSPGGVRPQPLRAGLHWIFPFLEHEIRYPIYWQTYTMSHAPLEGQNTGNDAIRARTSDGQEVRLSCSVIFRLDLEQLVSVHIDWQNRYIVDLVRPVTRGIVRRQVSQFRVREVNSNVRKDLEATLDRLLRQQFADKGLTLDQFLLRDLTFTSEYAQSIENKQMAFEGQEQKQYEAQMIINLANGKAEAIKIEAEAQAKAVELISEELKRNPDILTYRYIDKLAPNIRAMLVPTGQPLILPLPNLDGKNAASLPYESTPTTPTVPTAPTTTPEVLTTPKATKK